MNYELRLTILGCGSSPGVPRPNGDWGLCDPDEPRNRRRRCAALVERVGPHGRTTAVIDCGPDFREQMIASGVRSIDAVVMTHGHADHLHGLDDLRSFVLRGDRLMPVLADAATMQRMAEGFGYCFQTPPGSSYPPIARHIEIEAERPFLVTGAGGPIAFRPFRQEHGSIHSLGFRIHSIAYCADVSQFPPAALEAIRGSDWLVIDALQPKPHPSHFSLSEALDWIEKLGVPNAVLTHMHTQLDYRTLRRTLPAHVRPAFDGMVISVPVD